MLFSLPLSKAKFGNVFKEATLNSSFNNASVNIANVNGKINNNTESGHLTFNVLIQVVDDPFYSSGISGILKTTCINATSILKVQSVGPILQPVLHIFKSVQVGVV